MKSQPARALSFGFVLINLLSMTLFETLSAAPEEIGFAETFALAEDRSKAIEQLVPGTEEFYYYSALLAQQEGRLGDVAGLLEPWIKQHGRTTRVKEIEHRQALLEYSTNPKESLEYLRKELGLLFNHQQQKLDAKPDFPTNLDPAQISWQSFFRQSVNANSLANVTNTGLDRILRDEVNLNPVQRKELLRRLNYPDYERLVGLIAADLRERTSKGFGEYDIHRRLTLEQLDELVGIRTELQSNPNFVEAKLVRLRPNEDISLDLEPEERKGYYDRLWAYAETLPHAFNSLKASVLYQKLELAWKNGEYPRETFLEYLKLPKSVSYIEPKLIQAPSARSFFADLNADFSGSTGIPPVRNDEELVRDFLSNFLLEDGSINRFSAFVRDDYLNRLLAEAKLLTGDDNAEKWFSMLTPSQVQSLNDRVEISFSPANREVFAAEDDVNITVRLKNVGELIVKVYEINSLNYLLDQKREINTDLNLDGLVANEEKSYRYGDPPIRQRVETFQFDSIKGKRGVWVVEFIGNGISSRALIRKGKLQYLSQPSAGGELVRVLDETNTPVEDPEIWFGGKKYEADDNGLILLPFSEKGSARTVLYDGAVANMATISLPIEQYSLNGGVLLDQESLLPGAEAPIAIRPSLTTNGVPVEMSLLEDSTLSIITTDLDGVESTTQVENFELFDDRESIYQFRVPSRLAFVRVELSGKVPYISKPGEDAASCVLARSFSVNGQDMEQQVSDLYLSRFGSEYVLEALGKSGEPLPDRAVSLTVTHRDFARALNFSLKSGADGRIYLGELDGIQTIACSMRGGAFRSWDLAGAQYSTPEFFHTTTGQAIEIPDESSDAPLSRSEFALLEEKNGIPVRDVFEKAKRVDGAIRIENMEPGNYVALKRSNGERIEIRVTDSDQFQMGYVVSESRHLQVRGPRPMRIASLDEKGDAVTIKLANVDDSTRVHVVATRFVPPFDPYENFDLPYLPGLIEIDRGSNESLYVSGRDIGEEYRYILERRAEKKFPGNMLTRPGLILNPWALNKTETSTDDAAAGEAYDRKRDMREPKRSSAPGAKGRAPMAPAQPSSFDPSFNFLASPSVVISNIEPNEDGEIVIDRADLGDRQQVHVLAVNKTETSYRQLALAESDGGTKFRDLRLKSTLDLEKTFTQQRNVTLLREEQTLAIQDLRAAELETYDTLSSVYGVLSAIEPDSDFDEFRFVVNWPNLDDARKRELYSEYASHELSFFLSQKDPDFFEAVVKPYLSNKKDKTFIDHYLLEDPLDGYLAPWEYGRLNIVERILLARRIGDGEMERTGNHVSDLLELLPVDPQYRAEIFRKALRGRRSDPNGGMVADSFAEVKEAGIADPFAAPAPAGGGGMLRSRSSNLAIRGAVANKPMPAPVAAAPMEVAAEPMVMEEEADAAAFGFAGDVASDYSSAELREKAKEQALFRKLESTKEWAENNYYHLPIEAQVSDLITVNAFWEDFAEWDGKGGFYSREFPEACRNLAEKMFVLSVLDIPFEGEEMDITVEDNVMKLTAASPVVVFHEEIQEAPRSEEETPILVSQNFYRADDRYKMVQGQQVDKFVTDEFLTGVVYGSQVVVTNPTSSSQTLELLVQVPSGAIPVSASDYTKSFPIQLASFSTRKIDIEFYFPKESGDSPFQVYPVQVAFDEKVIASGESAEFKVVDELTNFDEASWEYLSQYGSEKEVIEFLTSANLQRIDLSAIAWRVRENVDFLRSVTKLVSERHAFESTLWSYGIFHNDLSIAREYLKHREDFLRQTGAWIDCELVSLEPVERHWYQHLEYAPLVNARSHRLGRERKILNDRFRGQYNRFLGVLTYKPDLSAEDQLAVAGYFFLQDRIDEALTKLEEVEAEGLSTRLQYDYLKAYASMYLEDPASANQIAQNYLDYPVDRWREKFVSVAEQVKEIQGQEAAPADEDSRESQMEKMSSKDPFFELTAKEKGAKLAYRNIGNVTVNYYEMDLEFLFSSKPFVSGDSGQFSYIKPNLTESKELPADGNVFDISLPEQLASKNVLVEVVGAGRTDSIAVYSNSLKVQLSENYGRIEVRKDGEDAPLPKAYVKVYAKMRGGGVRFFKDGYTDLRGKFDYVSLNTNELDNVEELSLLVMSEGNGSLVREVEPPQR